MRSKSFCARPRLKSWSAASAAAAPTARRRLGAALSGARLELQAESEFDAVVENGELEPALNELEALMGLV